MMAIYKRELRAYLYSFTGALFIGATLFLLGIYFSLYNLFMGYDYIGYALSSVIFLFVISIPILTMRILSEERHQKTDQLILTSPVSVSGIVIGKFLAAATVFVIPIAIISIYPLILSMFGTISFGESYVAVLGFLLYGLACIAIGVFISSVTESQVIAAVLSFGILFLGYVMSGLTSMISTTGNLLTKILGAFDMVSRYDAILNGSLEVESIVYYLSVIILFLVFTVQSIQKRRYHISKKNLSLSTYSSAVLVIVTAAILLLNLIVAELPSEYTTFDVTSDQLYSLSEDTKTLVKEVEEDVSIYVITSEKQADTILDTTLKKYEGLNSHIKVSYVDPAVNPKFYTQYTSMGITQNSLIVESSKRSKVIDYSSIYQSEYDYTTYQSVMKGYDGEGQITSAIAYVTTEEMPKMYMVEGHGELSFDSSFTLAIEKANIEYETINLMNYEEIPKDAACVVVNAPTSDFSEDDTNKMLTYMEAGGDVLLISTYTGIDMPNYHKLLDFYGVSVTEGLVIEAGQDYYYQDPFYLLPEIVYSDITDSVLTNGGYVFVPYAQGLSITEKEEVSAEALLTTSEESYMRSDVQSAASYTKQEGDVDGPFHLGIKCERDDSTAVIYSCESLFTENADLMVSGNNSRLFSGTISQFASYDGSISIPVKSYSVTLLTIPQGTIVMIALITTVILPFSILAIGFIVWLKRRKK